MSLIYNGTEITDVIYNGTSLNELIFNGVTVFTKQQPGWRTIYETDSPTLFTSSGTATTEIDLGYITLSEAIDSTKKYRFTFAINTIPTSSSNNITNTLDVHLTAGSSTYTTIDTWTASTSGQTGKGYSEIESYVYPASIGNLGYILTFKSVSGPSAALRTTYEFGLNSRLNEIHVLATRTIRGTARISYTTIAILKVEVLDE